MKTNIKNLTAEFFNNTWNSPHELNRNEFFEVFTDNLIVNSPIGYKKGKHELQSVMQSWITAFPDAVGTPEEINTYQNTVFCKWQAEGTHLGNFQGKKATGKKVNYRGETAFIFNHKKQIVHYIAKLDLSDIMQQLDISKEPTTQSPIITLNNNMDVLFQTLEMHYLGLTRREIRCLALFMSGFTSKQVGKMLCISDRTVEGPLEKARSILACHSKMQMMEKCLFEDTYFVFHSLARLLIEADAPQLLTKNP